MNLITAVIASTLIAGSMPPNEKAACSIYGDRAEEIMTYRQDNEIMTEVIYRAKGSAMLEEIILDAYKYPVMSLEKNKGEIIREFRNKRELMCFNTFKAS